ncbi:glycosyltransferase family protein [Alsobacter sp. SYSU BS001988]
MALAHALGLLGLEASVVFTTDAVAVRNALASADEQKLVISMGTIPLGTMVDNQPLHRYFSCPFYVFLLDPIIYDFAKFAFVRSFIQEAASDAHLNFLCPDMSYGRIIQKLIGKQVLSFQFAAFLDQPPDSGSRNGRAAVFANIGQQIASVRHDHVEEVLSAYWPDEVPRHLESRLIDALLTPGSSVNVSEALCQSLDLNVRQLFTREMLRLAVHLDSFEKRRRRLATVEQLKGFPLDFYGEGWSDYFDAVPSFRFIDPISFEQIARTASGYSAVINFDPNWSDGLHDRVYTALGAGCAVLTNDNKALDGLQPWRDRILTYDLVEPRPRDALALALQLDPAKPQSLTEFRCLHNWLSRTENLARSLWQSAPASDREAL